MCFMRYKEEFNQELTKVGGPLNELTYSHTSLSASIVGHRCIESIEVR